MSRVGIKNGLWRTDGIPFFPFGTNYAPSSTGFYFRDVPEEEVAEDFRRIKKRGMNVVRFHHLWEEIEPKKGEYDFRILDMMVRLANTLDLYLQPDFFNGWIACARAPEWVNRNGVFTDPEMLESERRLMQAIVERYREEPCIFSWDISNEINCAFDPQDDATFSKWCHMLCETIRSIDRDHPITLGLANVIDNPRRLPPRLQVQDLDYLTAHTYPMWPGGLFIQEKNSIRASYHPSFMVKLLQSYGKPCFLQEYGAPTYHEPFYGGDEDWVAAYFHVVPASALLAGAIGIMHWSLKDTAVTDREPYIEKPIERHFGILYEDGSEKKAAASLRDFARLVAKINIAELDRRAPRAAILFDEETFLSDVVYRNGIFNSYVLARRAHIPCDIVQSNAELSKYHLLFLPCLPESCFSVVTRTDLPLKIYLSVRAEYADDHLLQCFLASQGGAKSVHFSPAPTEETIGSRPEVYDRDESHRVYSELIAERVCDNPNVEVGHLGERGLILVNHDFRQPQTTTIRIGGVEHTVKMRPAEVTVLESGDDR